MGKVLDYRFVMMIYLLLSGCLGWRAGFSIRDWRSRWEILVREFGRDENLAPGENGCPKIQWLEFSVQLEGGY